MKFLAMVLALVISAEAVKVKSHDAEKDPWSGLMWNDPKPSPPSTAYTCRWEKKVYNCYFTK